MNVKHAFDNIHGLTDVKNVLLGRQDNNGYTCPNCNGALSLTEKMTLGTMLLTTGTTLGSMLYFTEKVAAQNSLVTSTLLFPTVMNPGFITHLDTVYSPNAKTADFDMLKSPLKDIEIEEFS
ncbi:uncharacterized protein ALTATR162_LOCUS2671 [Alternaria atra]|uniref:Uncharacterized protein n=1 Tax=Alternaria atra TaxID=119953 RepID=A0A8J2MZF0_9PLEO|nr:uncharacterized protein ALTATR162_LOCUS2671 [Alternaria atra]CAG5150467.1 unnamed protein product [Alternaria atra]